MIGLQKYPIWKHGTLGKAYKSTGNGIESHMVKSTEWGTAAMLAASDSGQVPTANSEYSTTGNDSGVFGMSSTVEPEYVAAIRVGASSSNASYGKLISTNYRVDRYEVGKNTIHKGDAVLECKGWFGANFADISTSTNVLTRGNSRIFYSAWIAGTSSCQSRAVVVCAAGV